MGIVNFARASERPTVRPSSPLHTSIAGIGALFFGSVLHIDELQKIGGTFFVLYCIEKLMEIPTRNMPAFAFLFAVVGTVTICFCWFALTHQELFRQFLFMPG